MRRVERNIQPPLWLTLILEAAVFSISGWWQTSPYPFAVEGRTAGMSCPDLVWENKLLSKDKCEVSSP